MQTNLLFFVQVGRPVTIKEAREILGSFSKSPSRSLSSLGQEGQPLTAPHIVEAHAGSSQQPPQVV